MKKILKFYSDTCGPCKVMGKALKDLKNAEIQEIDINDDKNDSLIKEYEIRSIPTILVVNNDDKGYIARFTGVTPIEKIQQVIDE